MILPPLYHWSPRERRKQIVRYGLRPGCRPTIATTTSVEDGRPVICLSSTPSAAWGLSGNMHWAQHINAWDLWQINIADTDEVHVLPTWGRIIHEVRIANRIPKSRLWWVAERQAGK